MIKVPGHEHPSMLPPNLHDVRTQAKVLGKRREAVRAKVGPMREWSQVTGICLHQTAANLGERPGRWASLGAHVGVTRAGKIIWVHDFDRVVWHGNGWNSRCVGVEIDGRYEGVEGDPTTLWRHRDHSDRDADKLTDETVEATKALIRWICVRVADRGGEVGALVAHRQSSMTRRSDPGGAIWRRVAIPMGKELDLGDGGPGFEVGGRPIPEEWDPERSGILY